MYYNTSAIISRTRELKAQSLIFLETYWIIAVYIIRVNPLFNTLATPTHAHLMRAVAVQQEQSSQLDAVIVGAVVHVASTVYGIDARAASPL